MRNTLCYTRSTRFEDDLIAEMEDGTGKASQSAGPPSANSVSKDLGRHHGVPRNEGTV